MRLFTQRNTLEHPQRDLGKRKNNEWMSFHCNCHIFATDISSKWNIEKEQIKIPKVSFTSKSKIPQISKIPLFGVLEVFDWFIHLIFQMEKCQTLFICKNKQVLVFGKTSICLLQFWLLSFCLRQFANYDDLPTAVSPTMMICQLPFQ